MNYLILFWEFFQIGLFTIGGGYAMVAPIKQVVESRGWLTENELLNFIAISESTPGPLAINLATFIGMRVGGGGELGVFGSFLGAFAATFAVVLPSFVIILIVTKVLDKFRTSKYVQGVLYGVKPVVVGLILSVLCSTLCKVVLPSLNLKAIEGSGFDIFNWVSLIFIAVLVPLSLIKIKGKKIHPIILIVFSAILGILIFGVAKL